MSYYERKYGGSKRQAKVLSNYTKFLKNLHTEQIAKLHAKNQHECDLLEDLRTYTIKRSAIEKSYSEALLKISSAYLNKKIPNIPDIKVDGAEEKWNMWNVWRTVLEENEKLARARLAAVEVFQQQIADEAKFLRQHKINVAKKCTDSLAQAHKELQLTVSDVDKTKKLYFDEEHTAHDVRDKAKDIEEKLKKKKGSFFQSITSLQKNSAKVSSRRDQLEEKSTGARNDYLLSISAANAHQNRYFLVELQSCMQNMESSVYEKVSEFLTLMGRTELLTCSATQHSFGKIRDQAQQLTREYNLQCVYLYYPVLKQHIQYDFEPCDNDPIDSVTIEHESVSQTLAQEARRWATRVVRETALVRDATRKLHLYQAMRDAGQKVDPNDANGPDLEVKMDELRSNIRRSETSKAKYEARLECLRVSGAPVDEWLKEVDLLAVQETLPRSSSLLSVRTDASGAADQPSSDSFYDSDNTEGEPATSGVATTSGGHQRTTSGSQNEDEHDEEVDADLEEERMRMEQLTVGWDDPTQVNWGEAEGETPAPETTEPPAAPLYKCTALYSYTAQNPDELSIIENEQLEVVGEGDGDGWLRARNYRGEEGYVPHNYLDVDREQASSAPGLVTQISFSSVDYTVEGEDAEVVQSPDQISVISAPVVKQDEPKAEEQPKVEEPVQVQAPQEQLPTLGYCFALYDYDAEAADELNLEEGQIIRIVSRDAHGVDDGWWRGEANGVIGNFPSLITEECDENGEMLSGGDDWTPLGTAPPVFSSPPGTPPAETFDDEMIVGDNNNTKSAAPPAAPPPPPPADLGDSMDSQPDFSFNLELSRNQHEQYDTQFVEQPSVVAPTVTIVVDEVVGDNFSDEEEEQQVVAPPPPKPVPPKVELPTDDCGLGVAQIVITAATPMVEEPDQPFPPPEAETQPEEQDRNEENDDEESSLSEQTAVCLRDSDEGPADSAPHPASSSTASEGESTGASVASGPPTAPQSPPSAPRAGRASIPDELEPAQLARLTDLKESNA
ncbi:protein nervous wreck isoform X2 [Epargyreus clarus]|uniref:protein nervous wreck isoform X2 n=1 Tax=Epargyreus clarus TaxID=520877 RepID=UPI003C2C7CAF